MEMKPEFRAAIENHYNIKLQKSTPVTRGQIAVEAYILEDETGHQYFCKFIDKPLFIPRIIRSLPVVKDMHDKGIERICYPIPGKSGLHTFVNDTLIVLYNFIPAKQGYDYDLYTFGQLLAEIHAITPRLTATFPVQGFNSAYQDFFATGFERLLTSQSNDPISQALQNVLQRYKDETRLYIAEFLRLTKLCSEKPCEFVITHGDVHGNVLVKSPHDIYIIDWDEMEFAPAECDMWLLAKEPGFMEGYKSIRPDFLLDTDNLKHSTLKPYFEGIMIHLAEILNEKADLDYRLAKIQKLEEKRLNGWMRPMLQKIIKENGATDGD